jgi:uncharacterized membrane protein YfcA
MELSLVVTILCLATLCHGTLGFGTGLIAMPLLTLLIGVQDATALVAFVILGTTILVLRRDWRRVEVRTAVYLVVGALPGIPLGILLLTKAPADSIQRVLGLLLIAYAVYALIAPKLIEVRHPAWAFPIGLVSGILGGAYNTNAPPVIIYSALRRWPPDVFRATLQAYFVPFAAAVCLGHGISGLWSTELVTTYTVFLPFGLVALWLGNRLSSRLPVASFERLLYLIISALGVLLLI